LALTVEYIVEVTRLHILCGTADYQKIITVEERLLIEVAMVYKCANMNQRIKRLGH
jgi:hypothetical protein